ncbi:MAG: NAD(P)-dependent oxidoreductase [Candidatus Paceibacterota bacterium]|jgi:nucleoside-diphosphate-sugar epimerase
MKKIALLGATGYIGRSLLREFFDEKDKSQLFLFSRTKSKVHTIVKKYPKDINFQICEIGEFNKYNYDVIINCTGIKSLNSLKQNPSEVFSATEEVDSMVIRYLLKNPKALYINMSSGAVYGDNFHKSISSKTKSVLDINNIDVSESYAIAKLNSEAKHRSLSNLNIVDLRVFAFFSRFYDVSPNFMISEIVDCLKSKKVFKTDDNNIVRDYITPKDLLSLIKKVMKKGKINDFFDVYSKAPISKLTLLSFLEKKYGLKYVINKIPKPITGVSKNVYYSKNKKAGTIGYVPEYSSLKGIESEISKIDNMSK